MGVRAVISVMLAVLATQAQALELPANARMTAERLSEKDSYAAPVAAFSGGALKTYVMEGLVRRQSWRIASPGLTPLQVLDPLRAQLQEGGYRIVLDCADEICGGFDFRFGTEVLPAPNMYVNIADYRFLTAMLGADAAPRAVTTLMVSSTRDAAYVQLIEVRPSGEVPVPTGTGAPPDAAADPISSASVPVGETDMSGLMRRGHVVLNGVDFQTGSTELGAPNVPVIAALAEYLLEQPGLRIALVGHTDSVGALGGNIAISKRRAQAVRQRLIEKYGIAGARIEAEGMGYLAPRASNLTKDGRALNRRVEAIVLSAD